MTIDDFFEISPAHATAPSPGQAASPVHRMRVQLQDDTRLKNHTLGIARSANANTGVTRLHIRNALSELFQDVGVRAPWFPLRLRPHLVNAIIMVSQKLDLYPPGGTMSSGNIVRVTFRDHGILYRVDVENLFGHNLRS